MSADRRTFLQFATLAPTVAVAGLAAPREARADTAAAGLTCSAFEPCVGEAFTFSREVFGSVTARLASVRAHPGCTSRAQREGCFSLDFDVQGEGALPQDSYRVQHARLGTFILFVSPRGAGERRAEAVFNRL